MKSDDFPIAALASAAGSAALAVLRLSGAGTHQLLELMLARSKDSYAFRQLHLCKLRDPKSKIILDEVMLVLFPAKQSFTGEESAEIFCHGGPYVVEKILNTLYELGFKPAEPGQFTQRAFLNGRLDLAKAEGIRELTQAQTEHQWLAANQLFGGKLSDKIVKLRGSLISAMALLEAKIDFPEEEDSAHISQNEIIKIVQSVEEQICLLLASYDSGKIAASGLRVALLGPPNAGKSTLLNKLLGHERAIVSEEAGTTRDFIEDTLVLKGLLIKLIDTAGIRKTDAVIEKMGIERSLEIAKSSDLIVVLYPYDEDVPSEFFSKLALDSNKNNFLKVATKSDLIRPPWLDETWISLSVKSEIGISQLENAIKNFFDKKMANLFDQTFITASRHVHALNKALQCIHRFNNGVTAKAYDEVLAFELLDTIKALNSIIGKIDVEEILDEIFSKFCMGK